VEPAEHRRASQVRGHPWRSERSDSEKHRTGLNRAASRPRRREIFARENWGQSTLLRIRRKKPLPHHWRAAGAGGAMFQTPQGRIAAQAAGNIRAIPGAHPPRLRRSGPSLRDVRSGIPGSSPGQALPSHASAVFAPLVESWRRETPQGRFAAQGGGKCAGHPGPHLALRARPATLRSAVRSGILPPQSNVAFLRKATFFIRTTSPTKKGSSRICGEIERAHGHRC
jgi:hypothetical protein